MAGEPPEQASEHGERRRRRERREAERRLGDLEAHMFNNPDTGQDGIVSRVDKLERTKWEWRLGFAAVLLAGDTPIRDLAMRLLGF